ncbi:MAG: dihydrolipoyl dehydrogenase [Myxococcaceae bacterium]|nr:dihydrolipoyl dehydrogenase [Myxococcaceae bacterium]MBH2006848.1 dihydrolipoyl dehydrogenase [Myxococcaceae bacterium]
MAYTHDLVVLGAGPGGYVAAARASTLGMRVALIEKDAHLGGTCLHRGCIPTKALLHAADVYSELQYAPQIGISVEGVRVEWEKIQKYKSRVINANAGGVAQLMKSRKVDVITGMGRLKGAHEVAVGDRIVRGAHILLAVGSTPRALALALDSNPRILNSDTALDLKEIPGSLVIIGGGVIGIEFASIFSRLGTKVTILEALPRVLASSDPDCSEELVTQFKSKGVCFHTDVSVTQVLANSDSVKTLYTQQDGEQVEIHSDYVLVSVGRMPLTSDIGIENTQIQLDQGFIRVNEWMQSDEPSIYAIGDCVNTPWLAHIASSEGILAVSHMAGQSAVPLNYDHTPVCVYSDPPVAWSGLSEEEAKKRGYEVKIGRFDMARNAKAGILGKKRGFIKFVTDAKYGEILGVHIVGPGATELLAEPAFAMQMEATIEDIANTVHAHPTLYEAIYEAAVITQEA